MGIVQASDLKGLLDDEELMADIADAVVETPGVLEALAGDIAEELEEEMNNAPALRKRIVGAALASPEFKKTLAAKLVSEMDDD